VSDHFLFAAQTSPAAAAASQVRRKASWPQRLLLAIAEGRLDWATGGRALRCLSGPWTWSWPLSGEPDGFGLGSAV